MNKDTIKQLDTREQCRLKLPIFFGSRDNFVHGLKEAIANAIDEISNNFDSGDIEVTLKEDLETIIIKDTGRGIPINKKTDGVSNYKLLFETLFAGSNYDNNQSGKITVGTNGCGLTVLNHTSTYFKVISAREGKIYEVLYKNGGEFQYFKEIGETDEHYSMFEFVLDKSVYTKTTYDAIEVKDICKYNSAVNNKVTIKYKYDDIEECFHFDSIEEYFDEVAVNNTSKKFIGGKFIYENEVEVDDGIKVNEKDEVEFVLTTSSEPVQQTFLNSNYLPNGGAINEGIINGVKLFANKYLKDKKMLDKKLGVVTNGDIEESISFVCSINSTNVEYENQIKLATNKKLYRTVAQTHIINTMEAMAIEKPKEVEKFIKHILEVQKFNNKAQANRKALKKKLSEKVDSLANRIEGLVDCKNHGMNSELFIAEGKSALGSIVMARNAVNQACIAIRGKIANCLKMSYDDIFKNETVTDIIKVLGCGIETDKKNKDIGEFHLESIRYGKIIIATDMDADGYQIACLLLTMFYRLTPTLIKNGMIYIALTPLYEVRMKDDTNLYWYSEEEKEKYLKQNGYTEIEHIARAKGLGELDAETMAETGVNPETRNIIQVTVEDVLKMEKQFRIWMGTDVTDRKEIIETKLNEYITID